MLGGHRSIFFDYMDAMGLSRYLPIMVYPKGKPDKAAYFRPPAREFSASGEAVWVSEVQANSSGALDTMKKATDYLKRSGIPVERIGIETTFMPLDAGTALKSAMPDSEVKDALVVLERQRLRKSPQELTMLKDASEKVIDAMLATIAQHGPVRPRPRSPRRCAARRSTGAHLRILPDRGGNSHNRAPSPQRWEKGDVLSVDSAPIITATSAISPAWRFWESRTPSLKTCSARSRRSSARRSSRSRPAPWAARSMRRARRWSRSRSFTTIWNSWRTAWASSATRRRI
jgi:hypothetical protein